MHKLRQTSYRITHRFSKPRQADFKYAPAGQKTANTSTPAIKQAQRRREHGAEVLATTSVSRSIAQAKDNGARARD